MDARSEPRWMTVADLLALVAGFAVAVELFYLPGLLPRDESDIPWDFGGMYARVTWIVRISLVALAVVVMERQVLFRRAARPAEWLPLVFLAQSAAWALQILDYSPGKSFHLSTIANGESWWPFAAALTLFVIGVGLSVVAIYFPKARPWLTLAYLPLLTLWLWRMGFAALVAISNMLPDFGAIQPDCLLDALVEGKIMIAELPISFVFCLPAVATIVTWKQGDRAWTWVQSAATLLSVLVGVLNVGVIYLPASPWQSMDRLGWQIAFPFMTAILAAICWLVFALWQRAAKKHAARPA